jgi:predicted heme/steroid binding protein
MKIKTLTIAAMLIVAAVALVGCTSTPAPTATATPAPAATEPPAATATVAPAATEAPAATATVAPAATEAPAATAANAPAALMLTVDELATYNGQNGQPAYIAVNGVIYDVTNVPQWKNGSHQGYTAGKDLTAEIAKAPHGESVLKNLPVVGKLK